MSLSKLVANQIAAAVRTRGQEYFALGRVRIKEHDEDFLDAAVKGSRNYHVTLERYHAVLEISCTCPYFSDHSECKHVWATVLAADAQNILQPKPGESTIAIESIPEDFDEGMDDDFENNNHPKILNKNDYLKHLN